MARIYILIALFFGVFVGTVYGQGTPGGSHTQVQFNDAGVLGGNAAFRFFKETGLVLVGSTTAPPLPWLSNLANTSGLVANYIYSTSPLRRGAIFANLDVNATTGERAILYGIQGSISTSAIGDGKFLIGVEGSGIHTSTGNIAGALVGVGGYLEIGGNASGVVGSAISVYAETPKLDNATVLFLAGLYAAPPYIQGSATVIENNGLYIEDQSTANASITRNIYSQGVNAINLFEGPVYGKFHSSDGTTGMTGTCTGAIVVKDGLVVSCKGR